MKPTTEELLSIPLEEMAARYCEMVLASHSHLDARDLLAQLHPRKTLDIKRRVDGVERWFEGDWLTTLMQARNGERVSLWHKVPEQSTEISDKEDS